MIDSHGRLVVDDSEQFAAPGHNSVATDDAGNRWLLYHAYERDEPASLPSGAPRRPMMLDPLRWKNGWPIVDGTFPSVKEKVPIVHER